MTRLSRSNDGVQGVAVDGSSKMNTAVMVDRSAGSFSMVHMSASASLIRSSYSISSIAGAYDASDGRGPPAIGAAAARHSLGGLQV